MAVLVSLNGRMLGWRMGTRRMVAMVLKVLKDVVVVVVVGWAASVIQGTQC